MCPLQSVQVELTQAFVRCIQWLGKIGNIRLVVLQLVVFPGSTIIDGARIRNRIAACPDRLLPGPGAF